MNRFIARRGKPHNVFSDNLTTFVGAFNELASLLPQDLQLSSIDTANISNLQRNERNGFGRVADIRTRRGVLRRALNTICPLLVNAVEETSTGGAVCNVRVSLTSHAGASVPPLLSLITDGPVDQLYIDILDTIIHWKVEIKDQECLEAVVMSLVSTVVEKHTDRMLMDRLIQLLDMYGNIVTIPWMCLEKYFTG
ncbi:unnamed protein product [Danaus chrysippus]|uniref:(African queen) hypothetical protein n=1 Tax=Danaus chrysippus TaxID=151541 RepID=A0A8J2W2V7_9NEOP|nr:unnamed protein product [Danaus chrysippus]